jgi:peroxiredoxin
MKRIMALLTIFLLAGQVIFAEGYKAGDLAIDFKLKNVDGKMVSLSDFQSAQGFIVIFTCNHCPFSVAYEGRIIELDKKYKSAGYPVIAVNPNDSIIVPEDSYSNMIVRADEKGFSFPYLLDADQSVAKTYGATKTPHVYLLQKENDKLIVKYIGAIDNNSESAQAASEFYVADAVDSLIEGENPYPDFTKAVGCSIKYAAK